MYPSPSGFLYFGKNESICYSLHWEHYFQHIILTKDNGEEGILGDDCLIDCSKIPMIYCNYETQDIVDVFERKIK